MADAFYVPDGERFLPTELTRGPWDPDAQHAGPPSALLGRALERHEGDGERQVGRVTFEILRPIPIAPLSVSVRTLRGGRSVELLEATLSDERGDVVRATAWRLRIRAVDLPGDLPREPAPPGPSEGEERDFFPTGQEVGYHTAIDLRFLAGGFLEPGPARVWMRLRVPVVEGEDPSPLQRVLAAADSGNGVSAALDYRRFVFINTDLSVHLHRMPAGEWVLLDAVTVPEPEGVGMAESALYDERGRIGRAVQTLMVAER